MNKKSIIALAVLIIVGTAISATFAASETNLGSESPTIVSNEKGSCISGVFRATEGNWTGTLSLYSNCTFRFVDREGRDIQTTDGTYSMDGEIYPGTTARITFYVGGESYGSATIAWPTEEGLQVWMNGYTFYKMAG